MMRQRLARKILAKAAKGVDVFAIYGKERCRQAYRQYYGYWLFYQFKYLGRPVYAEGETDWYVIVRNMYYKRFHEFNAKTCRIRLTRKQIPEDEE